MRKYLSYVMLFSICIFSSCRNYEKEFKALKNELEQKGVYLHQAPKSYVVIYEENGCVMSNDLDSCKVVFSPEKMHKAYSYELNVENTGKINVIKKIKDIDLDKNSISYEGSMIITYPTYYHIKISSAKFSIENENIEGYEYFIPQSKALSPILKTTKFYNENKEEERWKVVSMNASILSDKLNSLGLALTPLPGKLTMYFTTKGDEVTEVMNLIKYSCKEYGIEHYLYNFQNFEEIRNFYFNKMMEIKVKTEGHNFIKLEDISEEYFKNSVRADALYKEKILKIACDIKSIQNNDNLLLFRNYKYKLTASHSLLFGGIKIEAYTNDENFVNINYPAKIYMETTLKSAKSGYLFTNCKLIMVE